jgi:hypothetical protein
VDLSQECKQYIIDNLNGSSYLTHWLRDQMRGRCPWWAQDNATKHGAPRRGEALAMRFAIRLAWLDRIIYDIEALP